MKEYDENLSVDEKIEASPSKQRFVGLIDVVIIFLSLTAITIYQPLLLNRYFARINSIIIFIFSLIIYRLICLLIFNSTIGMKFLRVVLLNGEMKKLTIKEKLLASFFILYRGVSYYNK